MGSVMPGSSRPNRNNSWTRTVTVFISRPAFVTFAVTSGRISTDMSGMAAGIRKPVLDKDLPMLARFLGTNPTVDL
jgi:hypothetical protein